MTRPPQVVIVNSNSFEPPKPKRTARNLSNLLVYFIAPTWIIITFSGGEIEGCFFGMFLFGIGLLLEVGYLQQIKLYKSKLGESISSENWNQTAILTLFFLMIILPVLAYYVLLSMAQGFAG